MDWKHYILNKRSEPVWGAIALDHYFHWREDGGDDNEITPKRYIEWLIDNVCEPGMDLVAFHRVFLSVCVRLMGNDCDAICDFSLHVLSVAYSDKVPTEVISEITKHFSGYNMADRFKKRLLSAQSRQGTTRSLEEKKAEAESEEPACTQKCSTLINEVDVAIITVLPEEYAAVLDELDEHWPDPGSTGQPNLCAWELGTVNKVNSQEKYTVVVALAAQAGSVSGMDVTSETISRWNASNVLLVGVAGGFDRDGVAKGDVVVSRNIHGYEYGKIGQVFTPRDDLTYRVSQALLRAATAFQAANKEWARGIKTDPPTKDLNPKMVPGKVASGDKVVDDPHNDFFQQVVNHWSRLHAIEMEGVGAAHAADSFKDKGKAVRFLMIRGISDMPRTRRGAPVDHDPVQTAERDRWKGFASAVAAHFAIELIRQRWPEPPMHHSGETIPQQ